jgi:dolichol-phosphate mannosyltransferase
MRPTEHYIRDLRGPIVVLGASGFIGANLYHAISAHRHDVFAVVHREKGWRLADVPDDKVIAVDLNDLAATKNFVETIRPQTVLDCVAYGAYSFEEDYSKIYATNFQSLASRVGLLAGQGMTAYVHAGSSSEYGMNSAAPSENDVCEPNSHYSVSKVAAANYLRYMGKQCGFPCVHLRLYSVYGQLEDTSRLIPKLLKMVLSGSLPPFVDPRISRDFVYVADACRAFIMAAARMHPDLYGEAFNIGSGKKTTIEDLAFLAKKEFSIKEEPRFGAMEGRSWDLLDWYSDPRKAERELGWAATTPLVDGLNATSLWVAKMDDAEFARATKKDAKDRHRSVTAIIACYKDAEAIPYMHRRLTETFLKLNIDYEIIFVNDCSPDISAEVIEEISARDPHVLGVTHSRNFGSQMAFRSGMELASMNSVVLLDGDLQDPPELIADFHAKWNEGYDVVYGRRIKREMPWRWGILYKAFYRIFAAFSYVKVPLDAGDFSLIDRRVVGWLLKCPERDLFMRGLRAYVGFKQTGINYVRPERMFGVSTNSLLKNIDWAKRGIFSFSNTPLTLLTAAGVVLLGISIILAIVAASLKLFMPDIAPRGATTLLIAILFFGSFNLFAVGVVGEYVAKIMTEVKGRPRLIRRALTRYGKTTELLPDGKA